MVINTQFLFFVLILGAFLVYGQITMQMKWYGVSTWKSVPTTIIVIFTGLIGSQLWFFIENGFFEGRSLYGCVFLCPIVFFPVSKLIKVNYGEIMDFIAPAGCFVLGLAKAQCMRDGCCEGKILYMNEDRIFVRFPSQIVEFFVFTIIAIFLFLLSRNIKFRNKIYPLAMVIYGTARFFLDFFRDTEASFLLGLSKGSFWSLCSFVIGIAILAIMKYKGKKAEKTDS